MSNSHVQNDSYSAPSHVLGKRGCPLFCIDHVEAKGGRDMILTVPMEVTISFYLLIPIMNNSFIGTVDGILGCSQSFSFSGLDFGIQPH